MTTRTFFEPQGELKWPMVYDLLCLVDADPNPEQVERWTPIELLVAYDWAIREHLRASDNTTVRRRPKPWFVDGANITDDDGEPCSECGSLLAYAHMPNCSIGGTG